MKAARLIFLGAPGSGKGTQAQFLQAKHGIVQISTGDILRRNRAERTALGMEAQQYMDRGALVPDALIVSMMESELPREGGFILDGFPRTVPQAEALDGLLEKLHLPLTRVLLFEVPHDELITRLTGRWTNPRSGRVYHEKYSPPAVHGTDDEDGGPLVQRADDTLETVGKRLEVYERETKPLIAFYDDRRQLTRVDATQPAAAVSEAVERVLESSGAPA